MAGGEIEVRESIEAKGDMDTEMSDAPNAPNAPNHLNVDALGDVDAEGDIEVDADSVDDADADADGEPDDDAILAQDDSKDLTGLIRDTSEYLCAYKINLDGEYERCQQAGGPAWQGLTDAKYMLTSSNTGSTSLRAGSNDWSIKGAFLTTSKLSKSRLHLAQSA
jgi:hypothetical protein